jgi:hypothetical protein
MYIEINGPYKGCRIYNNFNAKEKRDYVSIRLTNGVFIRCITLAKYLMCIKENRILMKDEEVDHIDNIKSNDTIGNLQILSKENNKLKEIYDNNNYKTISHFICPICGTLFSRDKYQTTLSKLNQNWDTCGNPKCIRKIQDNLPKHKINDPDRLDELGFDKYYLGDSIDLSTKKDIEKTLNKNKVKYIKK